MPRSLSLPDGIVEAVRDPRPQRQWYARRYVGISCRVRSKSVRATEALNKAQLPPTRRFLAAVRGVYFARDQERIFASHTGRRVVSLDERRRNVPHGARHSLSSSTRALAPQLAATASAAKVQRLPIERISKASADQRKGRCGREAEGICIRLYSEEEFNRQEDFTPPEVLRTNLASVILRMADARVGRAREFFRFLDPPDTRLRERWCAALARAEGPWMTSVGSPASARRLPACQSILVWGRMLLAASHHNCVTEMLVINVVLGSAGSARNGPSDAQQASAQKHAPSLADARSDFITVLNLWKAFRETVRPRCRGASCVSGVASIFCLFIADARMAGKLHSQLSQSLRELELRPKPD